jgi:hypothetical protein
MCKLIAEDGRKRQHRKRLQGLIENTQGILRIASAYVTEKDILISAKDRKVRLLTSLLPMDIASGSTSLEALRSLIKSGVECRQLKHPRLHAKVYIFGKSSAVITSANLTGNALDFNIEVGIQIGGENVQKLTTWFDEFWSKANQVNELQLSTLEEQVATLQQKYFKLRDLLENATRFFVCNTNRRQGGRTSTGGYAIEQKMCTLGYATAWEKFKYPTHMMDVKSGDAIFLFAKGVGVIAVGRAKSKCEVLKPGAKNRMPNSPYQNDNEWRVPFDLLDWRDDDKSAYRCKTGNYTFCNVTDEKYRGLREGIRKHFLSQ